MIPFSGRMFYACAAGLLICISLLFSSKKSFAQYEMPSAVLPSSPPAQIQTIKAGSLIIPMDTVYQRVPGTPGYFNLKAYGLVNALLQNEIPVMWAIKAGKTRASSGTGAVDFTANVTRVYPDTTASGNIAFRNGPFIVDSVWATKAFQIISSYGNNVFVYKLNNNTSIDIRYNLTFKPHLLLLNGNGYDTITVHVLTEAGFDPASYKLQSTGQIFVPVPGYSLASDAHYAGGDAGHINPLTTFVNQYGGNLIANCTSIGAFENNGFFMTTNGIDSLSLVTTTTYYNPDLPIAQFLGNAIAPYGEFRYWNLKPIAGNTFKTTSYQLIRGTGASPNYIVTGAKLRSNSEKGSNVFYLPGHDYFAYNTGGGNLNIRINGRRIFLNSVFIPPNDSTHLDFITDVKLSMAPQSGFAVKNEPFKIYIIASNVGHWRTRNITVQTPFPPGLIYQSHTCANGNFNGGTGTWTLDSLAKGETDTLCITVLINQLGNIVFNGIALNESLEYIKPNNSTSLSLFGVSRPDANQDTVNFISPVYQDIDTKGNDTDEDGGPFGNSQIIAGPFHGTAQLLNGDSIRYTLTTSGYTGIDSLLYMTCDQYPLCDSTWVFINIQSPLPITLLRFDGKRNKEKIDLHWLTLTEKNNAYFNIERCTDNTSFETRGKIPGAGNSNVIREYFFTDEDNDDPVYYYRLRQFDFNGQAHLSPVIALTKKQESISFKLIPNPVGKNQQLLALIQGLQQGKSTLSIADMTGRVIIKKNITITEGNQLEFLDITESIETGCYAVTLTTPYETVSAKLIVN